MAAKKPEPAPVEIVAVTDEVKEAHQKVETSHAWKVTIANSIIAAIVTVALGLIQWQTQRLVTDSAAITRQTSAKVDATTEKVDTTIAKVEEVHVLTNDRATKQDQRAEEQNKKIELLNEQIRVLISAIAKQDERDAVLHDRVHRSEPPKKPGEGAR